LGAEEKIVPVGQQSGGRISVGNPPLKLSLLTQEYLNMDVATIIGLAAGFCAILISIIIGGASIATFIDPPSLLIVIGGTIAATLITFPFPDVMKVGPVVKNAFFTQSRSPTETIKQIVGFANQARRDGVLSLENSLDSVDDDFLRRGLQLAIDGIEPQTLRDALEVEVIYVEERHNLGQDLFNAMNKYCPAFGMIGTLIGLIIMLKNMSDPTAIGPAMAVALITTFYGALFSNLVFAPIAAKLKNRSGEESLYRTIVVEGVVMILLGEQPRMVEEKLKAFLSPKIRQVLSQESGS
jgi:chemotaxis protein MotA